jgi:polyphosphate kinase 2 (PPK2 family)
VEYVMGFCTPEQHRRFLALCPMAEKFVVDDGIILLKIWLEVGQEEQDKRFRARIDDPMRQWKLSPMDVESYGRWDDYSKARDLMLEYTDTKHAPWYLVDANDKRRARLNCISHILSQIPYERLETKKVRLPSRAGGKHHDDRASLSGRRFVEARY